MDREVSRQVGALNLQILTVWSCVVRARLQVLIGGFTSSLQERERLLRSKRHRGKSLKPPKVSEPTLVSVRNLQDNPVFQGHRASRRPRGGDMTLCHS